MSGGHLRIKIYQLKDGTKIREYFACDSHRSSCNSTTHTKGNGDLIKYYEGRYKHFWFDGELITDRPCKLDDLQLLQNSEKELVYSFSESY
jgi:hypothetical protein